MTQSNAQRAESNDQPETSATRRHVDTARVGNVDIAAVVSFLAGPEGGWINGQVLRANGGLV